MKSKKAKKHRPNAHIKFTFSDDACRALSNALLFMLNLNDFSFADEKINLESASVAEDKLFDKETVLTRGEVRATAKAIDTVFLRFPGNADMYKYMEEDFPNFLSDLEKDIPILQELQPIFQEAVKELRKMK